jgi:hypothetical protein
MASFSASDAAFTGFRVVREHPTMVLFLAVIQVIFSVGLSLIMIALAGPALTQLQNLSPTAQTDPLQSMRLLQQIAPLYLVLTPVSLMIYAVFYGAMNRAVLRPAESQFGYLRLGADEFRQLGLLVLMFLLFIGVYIAAIIGGMIVGLVVGMLMGMVAGSTAGGVLGVTVGVIGVLAAMVFVGVRLSLASAQTFATRSINLFGSWTLTKGRFWPLLGTYLLVFCLLVIMGLLAVVILGSIAVIAAGGMSAIGTLMKPDMSTIGIYFTPARILTSVLSALLTALFLPVSLTPPAAVYQSLTAPFGAGPDGRPATVESIFS